MLRGVIVEDEPQARQNLREYSAEIDWLTLVGEAGDGVSAVELIERLEPDLVFLDVSLPELSGLQVLERIQSAPAIVFTTAYDRFAVAAFEVGALDYLLKPFGRERFQTTLERVRKRLLEGKAPAAEGARPGVATPWRWLFARAPAGIVPIEVRTVRHLRADGDYVEVHCASGTHLLHLSLGELEARLDPEQFCRVHRSHIVNLEVVEKLTAFDQRRFLVNLKDGTKILASRSASERLRRLIR
jgi:two-component system LytT family response regulator